VKLENGGEGTNCGFTLDPEVDWHIPLVAHAHDPEKLSIVVETTPRVRKNHPKWTTTALAPWVNGTDPVRISGWLMFDPDHPPMMYDPAHPNAPGKYRITLNVALVSRQRAVAKLGPLRSVIGHIFGHVLDFLRNLRVYAGFESRRPDHTNPRKIQLNKT
jgi:hypothetical protein